MGGVAKSVGDFVSDAFDAATNIIEGAVDFIEDVGKFTVNVHKGIFETVGHIVHGAITGDWVEFRDGVMGAVTTAVAVAAIVVGGFLTIMGVPIGPLILAAGFTVLDAQYNEGKLLSKLISYAAEIEKATTRTSYIEEYAAEIQGLITTAAIIGVGVYGGGYLSDISGLTAAMRGWSTQLSIIKAGYGGYQTYMAVQSIKDSQDYWEAKIKEAEEYYRNLIAQAQAAKDQWFSMMTDPDMINRIQAGGDLFLMGAGHEMMSVTSVAEPRYALGLIDKSDTEMDRLMNNRYYMQYAGNDAFKPN